MCRTETVDVLFLDDKKELKDIEMNIDYYKMIVKSSLVIHRGKVIKNRYSTLYQD